MEGGPAEAYYDAEYSDGGLGFLNLNGTALGPNEDNKRVHVSRWRQLFCTRMRPVSGIKRGCAAKARVQGLSRGTNKVGAL